MTLPHVWAPDRRNRAEHEIRRSLVRLSQEVKARAECHPDEKQTERLHKTAVALQGRTALTKVIPELQAHPELTMTVEDFDADDWILNTPDGIVDLRSGEVRASDPSALCSKATAVGPGVETRPARWLAFLAEATGGDTDLQAYLQKLVGYALTGSTQEQILAFIHGPPMTGKSVFIDTVAGLFGSYHENAPSDTFAKSRGDRHPTDLAKLAGARLVTSVETEEGRSWDTQRVKMLTGGDQVSARFMRQDFFSYRPRYQIVIVGNHEPEIHGVDAAMMRRLHVIPFEHKPAHADRLLRDKLRGEWPGILAWAIEGCLLWLRDGLSPPPAVVARTEQYRSEEDPVEQFLTERCEFGEDYEVTRRALYIAWQQFCHQQGEQAGGLKTLKRRFRSKEEEYGFRDARVADKNGYRGLRLKADSGEEFEA